MALTSFWLLVWSLKLACARLLLLPLLLESHSAIVNALPLSSYTAVYGSSLAAQLLLRLQPRMMLRASLQLLLWATGGAIYIADTLGWYQLVLGVWGGYLGLQKHGVAPAGHYFGPSFYSRLRAHAQAKLLLSLAATREEVTGLVEAAAAGGGGGERGRAAGVPPR